MDYAQIEKELVVALRGSRSQMMLSRRLGFSSNKVYKWESGLSRLSWGEFIHLAKCCKADYLPSLQKILGYKGSPEESDKFFAYLMGATSKTEVAKKIEVSENLVNRWLSGKSEPSLGVIFKMIHVFHLLLPEFIVHMTEEEKVPSIKDLFQHKNRQKVAIGLQPELELVMAMIQLDKTINGTESQLRFISEVLGISSDEALKKFERLVELDLARNTSERFIATVPFVETGLTLSLSSNIRRFWLRYINHFVDTLEQDPLLERQNFFGYDVFAVSDHVGKEMVREYYQFYARIRTLIENDTGPKTTVKLLATQVLDVNLIAESTKILPQFIDEKMATTIRPSSPRSPKSVKKAR